MDLKTLKDTPPWDWPEDASKMILEILRDHLAGESDRLFAAELAGDFTVINDTLADTLLSIVHRVEETEELRCEAAISLGTALQYADIYEFEDTDDAPITEKLFRRIQESLHKLYMDKDVPKEMRRHILEASVQAPQNWHQETVSTAYSSNDKAWKLTAVFCMRFVRGFEKQILEALDSKNPEMHTQAVCAAGNWKLDVAWQHIAALVTADKTDKPLRLAAIESLVSIRPQQASEILVNLTASHDEDITEAIYDALTMADGPLENEDDDLSH